MKCQSRFTWLIQPRPYLCRSSRQRRLITGKAGEFQQIRSAHEPRSAPPPPQRDRFFMTQLPLGNGRSLFCRSAEDSPGGETSCAPGAVQDLRRFGGPISIIAVNREQDPTIFHAALVAFRFLLRNAHSNQGPSDACYGAAHTYAR
jgi:hypothetical protein